MNQKALATGSSPRQFELLLVERVPSIDPDINDPRSASYRYADTGYIAGSRKEEAASQIILRAKRDGLRVHSRTIDWESLESNPREAKALITKSNLFGLVDWDGLRADGLQPAAGFLIDRVYAAVGQNPDHDSPQARKDYTFGLQSLRDRMERCKTIEEVTDALAVLREESQGITLTPEEDCEMNRLNEARSLLGDERRSLERVSKAAYDEMNEAAAELALVEREIGNRTRRGWKVPPELEERQATAKAVADVRRDEWIGTRGNTRKTEIEEAMRTIRNQTESIYAGAKVRNEAENQFYRSLNLMGERLTRVLWYRNSSKGSDAFAKHVAAACAGLIADWSWQENEASRASRVTKESVRFQFKIADRYERVGGRRVEPGSTSELKEMFAVREVQSGNWVLRDVASAKFHTDQTAAAFADLADLMGIADRDISQGQRLAIAFGARGKGSTGGKGRAPQAHYELIHRVINITKEKGGGSLGHEWFHSLDNLIVEMVTGAPGPADFATSNPDMLPSGELRDAFRALVQALVSGSHQATQTLRYSAEDVKLAARNVKPDYPTQTARLIMTAGNVHDALRNLERKYGLKPGEVPGRGKKNYLGWRRIAMAYYGGDPMGGEVEVRGGPTMSSFKVEALRLDGTGKEYYSIVEEMAARAFQSWIEDRLAEQGRRNDYLSTYADNRFYVDPISGIHWKPYPEGEERQRINAAFDRLAAAFRQHLKH